LAKENTMVRKHEIPETKKTQQPKEEKPKADVVRGDAVPQKKG